MLYWLTRPIRFFVLAFTSKESPKQMAAGAALGLILGLVPKGNLIAWTLMLVLMGTRASLALGAVSAFLFSWVAQLSDPLAYRLGYWLLTRPQLTAFYTRIYNLPLVPWTNFNYPVVLGNLYLGLGLAYPLYRSLVPLFGWLQPKMAARLEKWGWLNRVTSTEFAWTWRMG